MFSGKVFIQWIFLGLCVLSTCHSSTVELRVNPNEPIDFGNGPKNVTFEVVYNISESFKDFGITISMGSEVVADCSPVALLPLKPIGTALSVVELPPNGCSSLSGRVDILISSGRLEFGVTFSNVTFSSISVGWTAELLDRFGEPRISSSTLNTTIGDLRKTANVVGAWSGADPEMIFQCSIGQVRPAVDLILTVPGVTPATVETPGTVELRTSHNSTLNGGNFTCAVDVVYPVQTILTDSFSIEYAPVFQSDSVTMVCQDDSCQVTLNCSGHGILAYPAPTLTWLQGNNTDGAVAAVVNGPGYFLCQANNGLGIDTVVFAVLAAVKEPTTGQQPLTTTTTIQSFRAGKTDESVFPVVVVAVVIAICYALYAVANVFMARASPVAWAWFVDLGWGGKLGAVAGGALAMYRFCGQRPSRRTPSPLQVPINFLGDFKAGKSSLAASLQQKHPVLVADEDRTVGGEVTLVRYKGIDFYIHDFGGHPSYRFLHHLYLPSFAIHVVFIKIGLKFDPADCCRQLNEWMFFVSAKVPNAKVFVVLSKVDLLTEADLEEAESGLNHQLQSKINGESEVLDNWSSDIKSALASVRIDGKELPGYETILKNLEDAERFRQQHALILGDILCVSCKKGEDRGLEEFLERCASVVKDSAMEQIDGRPLFYRVSDFHGSWEIFLDSLLKCRGKDRGKGRLALPMSEVRQKAEEAGVPIEDIPPCLFLFKVTGHILHYESSENDLDKYVFHDPELLSKAMGHLVRHDLTLQFENYLTSLPNMPDEDAIRRNFRNGWVPHDFLKLQLSLKFQSEGASFEDAVVLLSRYIGLCIVIDKQDSQGRQMVFVPCLVTRSRSEVDLSTKWGPVKKSGWEDFVMDLRLHKGLPVGFVERVLVEAAPFTRGNVNFKNGFFCIGWNGCPMLLEEVSEPANKFSRLRFKIRAESANREVAAQDMTWLYFVFQKALSYYPGVLAHIVTPCQNCGDHSYDVKGCLNQPYEVLKSMECPLSSKMNPHSAADVFPVKKPETLGDASIPTLDLQPAGELSVQDTTGAVSVGKHLAAAICRLEPSGELSVQDIDPSTVYTSRCNPKDLGRFAYAFGQKVNKKAVAEIASYLFESGELLFSVMVLSADELEEFEEGKKRGSHLIRQLKKRGVITKLSDGTFNYNGLMRILFAVKLGGLCDQLLQKNPEDTSAT